MILRECFFGTRRFEEFQRTLDIPRYTLTVRLRRLMDEGVLCQVPYSRRPLRHEYGLTDAGLALYPIVLALVRFGDRWLLGGDQVPIEIVHARCGAVSRAQVNCSHCSGELLAHRTRHRDGPGSGTRVVQPDRRGRPTAEPTAREGLRPSNGARTLRLIGDRWRFMIIREAFFRARRIAEFEARLDNPPAILRKRLDGLVADGLFRLRGAADHPHRLAYGLTDMGRDLFGAMLALMRWGDDWRAGGAPPLLLTHLDCGHDCAPVICCDRCGETLAAGDMHYRINYRDPLDTGRATRTHGPYPASEAARAGAG